MRIKLVTLSAVCALALGINTSHAADDVYVDLSVLGSLEPGAAMFVPTQPLFPVVSKSTSQPVKAKKTAKKKKTPAKKKVVEVAEEKVEVVPAEPEKINILQEVPAVSFDNEAAQAVADAEKAEPAPVAESAAAADKIISVPVTEVKQETVAPIEVVAAPAEETPAADAVQKADEIKQTAEAKSETPVENQSEPLSAQQPEPAAAPAEAEVVKPLIPVAPAVPAIAAGSIYFADDSYEVSPENQQKISAVINGFENPQKNKIAIYAYNYDDGENSFKKKKLSLDRATEIRSYLLNNGYKNFSIKVINVTDDAEKRNLVEIEEIK